jgi:predicted nucleotidyltransferase
MTQTIETTYPPVTDALLGEAVERIRAVGDPLKIVLFGSHARGTARPHSDLDPLIVEESSLPRYRRAPRYLRALLGLHPAKDVVVWTPAEIAEWAAVPQAFITTALREGKVLYEQPR